MDLQDLITIALVLACVWTFIPRHLRRALRSGLEPAVITLADVVRDVSRVAGKALTHAAYRGLLGEPVPEAITVKSKEVEEKIEDVAPTATKQQNNNNAIATPATDDNALLFQQRARDLALAVHAKKIGETAGIKLYFGVSPSSTSPAYIAARAALKVELAKLDPPKFRRTPEMENAREALGLNKAR
jgi:hypothetical protein